MIFVASIDSPVLKAVIAAIKTLAGEKADWRHVFDRLIEEHREINSKTGKQEVAAAAGVENRQSYSEKCEKNRHFTSKCFWNINHSNNELHLKFNKKKSRTRERDEREESKHRKHVKRHKESRTCVAHTNEAVASKDTSMLLDSGTTTDMVNALDRLQARRQCDIIISLGDNSSIKATHKGACEVTWSSQDTDTSVTLSNTLFSKDLAMNLLSISALARA